MCTPALPKAFFAVLLESLGDFYEHKWITDVLMRVKGGKEASVYLCRSGDAIDAPLAAATASWLQNRRP